MGNKRKNDIILIGTIILIAFISMGICFLVKKNHPGQCVVIEVDGVHYGTYDLSKDMTFTIETDHGYNVVSIQNNEAMVVEADCRDLICQKHKAISKNGETIVCLPHKVSLIVQGEGDDVIDIQ